MDDKSYGQSPEIKIDSHAVEPDPTPTVHEPNNPTLAPYTTWRRGVFRRLPWLGMLSLLGVILTMIAMAVILSVSNGQPVTDWGVSPAVYLAIISTLTNIFLAYALGEGTAIAWWVKAMKTNAHISDLHNIWHFGTSIWGALFSGRSFNLVALACILVAIAPLNGPLLQRASNITTRPIAKPANLTIHAAQEIPAGYTGTITGRLGQVGFVTSNFSSVVQDYVLKRPINVTGSGCIGTCTSSLQAAGYAIDCTYSPVPFNLTSQATQDPDPAISGPALNGSDIFFTNFTFIQDLNPNEKGNSSLLYTSLHKTDGNCFGNLARAQCTLKPAIIQYPVVLINDSISLNPNHTYKDDHVVEYTAAPAIFEGPTAHGGMFLALNSMFSSSVLLQFSGAKGYDLRTNGSAGLQYALAGLSVAEDLSCPTFWSDPTDDMLAAARELAFRTALHAANSSIPSNTQILSATAVNIVPVFQSTFSFYGTAAFFTGIAFISVFPIFPGWWRLGRKVSLSPVEIAKAFDAPILSNIPDSNLPARRLLKDVGKRPVMYGVVDEKLPAYHDVFVDGVAEKLAMGVPDKVEGAVNGRSYSGF